MKQDREKPAAITLASTVQAAPDQVAANLVEEAVILNLTDGIYYGLNPVGARIWNLIQTPRTVQEVQDTLLEEYEVEPQRCRDDLLALLQKMVAKGLITIIHGKTA